MVDTLKRQWGFSYRNGPLKNKNQLCKDNFFLVTCLGEIKSGTAGSCLNHVKTYLLRKVIRQTAVSCKMGHDSTLSNLDNFTMT
jgi:hypothetical protein